MSKKVVRRALADGTIKEYVYERRPDYRSVIPVAAQKFGRGGGDRPCFVYFLQAASGPIKIGRTDDFEQRFQALQDANFDHLTTLLVVLATRRLEYQLLMKFRDLNIRGEWFRPHDRITQEIGRLKDEFGRRTKFSRISAALKLGKTFSTAAEIIG